MGKNGRGSRSSGESLRPKAPAASTPTPPPPRVPALTILCHPEADRVGELATLPQLAAGERVALSRLEPTFAAPGSPRLRPLGNAHLSRQPILLTANRSQRVAVERAGSRTRVDVEGQQLHERRAVQAAELEAGVVLDLGHRIVLLLHWHQTPLYDVPSFDLVGHSSSMQQVREEMEHAAGFEGPVLLRGEPGTGKERVARALHATGRRRAHPYVALRMATLADTQAAAALFGGTPAGARQEGGVFERAEHGTLFVDEIGEATVQVQSFLLRALAGLGIQSTGNTEARRIDALLIAASALNLEAMVDEGRFEARLLRRLSECEIHLPPLRERRADFGRLLYHFLHRELKSLGEADRLEGRAGRPWPPAELVARLAQYAWPGNVSQLENVARRLALSARAGGEFAVGHLLQALLDPEEETIPASEAPPR